MGKVKFDAQKVFPQLMKFGFNIIPQNSGSGGAPSDDGAWLDLMRPFQWDYLSDPGGSLSIWHNFLDTPTGLYNIALDDINARKKNVADVGNGLYLKQPSLFNCFKSDINVAKSLNCAYSPVLPFQRPPLDGRKSTPPIPYDYKNLFAQIDFIRNYAASQGVPIYNWRSTYEIQVMGNSDLYPTLQSLVDVTTAVATYIHSIDANAKFTCCAMISDDITCRFGVRPNGMNAAMSKIQGVTHASDYFQIQNNVGTYPLIRQRLAQFPSFADLFNVDFYCNGIQMEVSQEQFGADNSDKAAMLVDHGVNPYTDKVGQGLAMCELLIRALQTNTRYGKPLVGDFTLSQSNGLISGARIKTVKPNYYMMLLLSQALKGTTIGDISFINVQGAENLIGIGAQRGENTELYIQNCGDNDITMSVNIADTKFPTGHRRDAKINNAWGGALDATVATNYFMEDFDDTITLKAHTIHQIFVAPIQ